MPLMLGKKKKKDMEQKVTTLPAIHEDLKKDENKAPEEGLDEKEKKHLKRYQGSGFSGLLTHITDSKMELPEADRTYQEKELGWGECIEEGAELGWGILEEDMGGTADSTFNLTETLDKFEFPWFGVVKNGIKLIGDFIKSAHDLIPAIKTWRKSSNNLSKAEKYNIIKEILDRLCDIADNVKGGLEVWGKAAKEVPILGLVISVVTGMAGFISDGWALLKSYNNVKRMRAQKEAAKQKILAHQSDSEKFVNEKKSGKLEFNTKSEMMKTKAADGKRKLRLDEITEQKRSNLKGKTEDDSVANERALTEGLEDYDITKELTGANEKRVVQAGINIVTEDLAGIVSAAVKFAGPGGLMASAGMDLAIAIGSEIKSAATSIRHLGREWGWAGFDQNKSDINKLKRRHTLAVHCYDHLKVLGEQVRDHNINNVSMETKDKQEIANVRTYLPQIKQERERIDAMGVGTSRLMQTNTGLQLVAVMRSGFYRDNDD